MVVPQGSGMPALPTKFGDGNTVATTSDLKSQYQGHAAQVGQDYDPKADYKLARSEVRFKSETTIPAGC